MDINLSAVDGYLSELNIAIEDINAAIEEFRGSVSVSIESRSGGGKRILDAIWSFIKRVGAAVARIFGMVGNTTETLGYSLDAVERRLGRQRGRRPKEPYIEIKHESNYVMVGNDLPQTPSEYNAHIGRLLSTLETVMKYHLPSIKKTSAELKKAYASNTKDPWVLLNEITKAAENIDLSGMTNRLNTKPIMTDNRFPRTRPVYKGPDLIGNRSIFIDIPLNAVKGDISDVVRATKVSEARISYISSYQTVDRNSGEVSIRSADYDEIKDMVSGLRGLLRTIDKYPINELKRDQKVLEDSFNEISRKMDRMDGPDEYKRYMGIAARMLSGYGTWITNPHTQLITSTLTVTRGMVTIMNKQLSNY